MSSHCINLLHIRKSWELLFSVHGYDSTRMYLLCISHLAQQNYEVLEVQGVVGNGRCERAFLTHKKSIFSQ